MLGQVFRAGPARAVALACAVWMGGCKKQEPVAASGPGDAGAAKVTAEAAPAVAAADAGTVTAEAEETRTPFVYKNVKLTRDTAVKLTYTLENHGRKRARGQTCVRLYDKDGYFIDRVSFGVISLKGGESDVFEDTTSHSVELWSQAHSLQLFAADNCYSAPERGLSPVRHLDADGRPLTGDAPQLKAFEIPEPGSQVFAIKDVRLSQAEGSDTVDVTFTVTNRSATRASGSLCVRLHANTDCKCAQDEAASDDFNLAPGATTTVTSGLVLDDELNWNSTAFIKAYAAYQGCGSGIRLAMSNVEEVEKPEDIRVPRVSPEEPQDDDEGSLEEEDESEIAAPAEEDMGEVEVDDP